MILSLVHVYQWVAWSTCVDATVQNNYSWWQESMAVNRAMAAVTSALPTSVHLYIKTAFLRVHVESALELPIHGCISCQS